jgi:glucose-6-phosphate dehydrogenase assembly protein OpcA
MPAIYKVLGQSYPSATTLTTLYTAPSSVDAIVSTINIANLGSAQDTIRIAICPAGASIANQHYIAYNVPLAAGSVLTFTIGATLDTTDIISVYSLLGTSSFNAFGSEVS